MMRIRRAPAFAALALVGALSIPAPAPPSAWARERTGDGGSASIDSLRGDLDGSSAQERQAVAAYEAARTARAAADGALGALDQQLTGVSQRVQALEGELARIADRLDATQRRIDANRVQLEATRSVFAGYVRELYQGQGGAPALENLLEAGSTREWAASTKYSQVVTEQRKEALDQYQALRIETEELQRAEQHAQRSAQVRRDTLAAERDRIAGLRNEQVAKQASAAAAERNVAGVLASIRSRKAQFQAAIDAKQAELDRIAAEIRRRGSNSGSGGNQSGNGRFQHPVQAPVTSPYGYRIHPITHTRKLHTGIDFGAAYGSAIHAAGDGVVISAGRMGGYGNATVIDHGGGLSTLYGHQSRIVVSVGQRVRTGDVIGYVGSTGNSTGPHLHFEVRVNGTPVNPVPYL